MVFIWLTLNYLKNDPKFILPWKYYKEKAGRDGLKMRQKTAEEK